MDRVQKHAGRVVLAFVTMLQIVQFGSEPQDYIETQQPKVHSICIFSDEFWFIGTEFVILVCAFL